MSKNQAITCFSEQLENTYLASGLPLEALDFYQTPDWFGNLALNCLRPEETPIVLVTPGIILPIRARTMRFGPVAGKAAHSLSNFYSCRFSPPGLANSSDPVATSMKIGKVLKQAKYGHMRLDALDAADCQMLSEGIAKAGWLTESFAQFGNWHLKTEGLRFPEYWTARPGKLRNTGIRRGRAFSGKASAAVKRYTEPSQAAEAISAYLYVANRSWQKTEPFPNFLPKLIRDGLASRQLSVWALVVDDKPVAAQIWVWANRQATIFKLAFDQDWRKQSAGTVLTMHAMETALNEGDFSEIDFGWGDDSYKQQWLPERRQRYGLAAYNPATALGLATAARNLAPKLLGAVGLKPSARNKPRTP